MKVIQGNGVSGGIAVGPLYYYHSQTREIKQAAVKNAQAEWQRFQDAQAKAIDELAVLAERARAEAGDEAALLFETHQMMAEDLDYEEAIQAEILAGGNAEAAVYQVGEQFAAAFSAMEDAYMQARALDVRDVSSRISGILLGHAAAPGIESETPVILVADDLTPSETIQLNKEKILGFVTRGGSATSHTAILARAMSIPAVVGMGDTLDTWSTGTEAALDGDAGTVTVEPDPPTREDFERQRAERFNRKLLLNSLKGQESKTLDGRKVKVFCNIGDAGDAEAVLQNDGEGIGLFRSEFLFLGRDDYPSEEQQFCAYKQVLSRMSGREVIIRTLDIGADKQIGYFNLPQEANPAMGNRALRLCLSRPDVFRVQLRALYRASVYGKLSIMFPMVTSLWEVREAKRLCRQVQQELAEEGIRCSDEVRLGIMIETPAAALISDQLAKEVDFFSCGTNDLTQYTLACDRQNGDLGRFYAPHHPAILRLLKFVFDNAHANGIWVGICGELAADAELLEAFLLMGVDELSVSPGYVLPLRQKIRELDLRQASGSILETLTINRAP